MLEEIIADWNTERNGLVEENNWSGGKWRDLQV